MWRKANVCRNTVKVLTELLYSLRYQTIQVIATALSYFMDCLFKMYSLIVCIIGLKEKLVQTGWYKNCGKTDKYTPIEAKCIQYMKNSIL